MTRRHVLAGLVLGIVLTGCTEQQALTAPPVPATEGPGAAASSAPEVPVPSAAPRTPSAAATTRPSSAAPLSLFEADPAVQALRAHSAAVAQAVNSGDLALPALRARVTARRAAALPELLADDLGGHFPGPQPVEVLGVRTVSAERKEIAACSLEDGWVLDRPGGQPTQPDRIAGGRYLMLLQDGGWRIDSGIRDDAVACAGLTKEDFA